jgi:hypothetical protein
VPTLRQIVLPLDEWIINDFLQKTYTDDGNGNGRFTLRGFQMLQRMADSSDKQSLLTFALHPGKKGSQTDAAEAVTFQVLVASVAAVIADRKNMQAELLRLYQLVRKERTRVSIYGRFADSEYVAEYQRIFDSPHLRLQYLPALIIMPNANKHSLGRWSQTAKNQVRRDAALVVIAAERHRRQHGQFPKTADELVPTLLPDVPIDPYTSKPLRYSVKHGLPTVDSVGLVEEYY